MNGAPDAAAIRASLRCNRSGCPCQRPGPNGPTHCPLHSDDSPSLNVTAKGARVLFHCFGSAQCTQERLVEWFREHDLWPRSQAGGLTLEGLAAAKRLPVAFLRGLGLRTTYQRGLPRVHIPYSDQDGEVCAVRYRHALDGPGRFTWRRGDKPLLYGLDRLPAIRAAGWCLLVEGESDCWTGWLHDLPVLGLPGKATWRPEWAREVSGLAMYVWQEPGAADLAGRLASDLPSLRVIVPPAGIKDLNEAHVRGEEILPLIERLRAGARPVAEALAEAREAQRRQEAEVALGAAAGLLDDPNLLRRVEAVLGAVGLAGDKRNAMLLYLALTSRLLARPVNVSVEGPSAAGKNYLVSCVLTLHPPEAVYSLTASSERLLAFTEEDLRHRVLVVGEATGLHRDGVGATILRTLAWEGRLVYEVVEKTSDGLRPRRIEKSGPTGLITTTTRALDPELATRLLTITVRDDPGQTRLVLRETGRRAANGQTTVDVGPFIAAQRWLEVAGARDVVVPFAEVLAGLVDASAVRVRRDFTQLLTLIQASGLLHQRQRPRDRQGRVVASLDDYRVVHDLVAGFFESAAADELTPAQREAVAAVTAEWEERGDGVSFGAVAARLGIDKSAARRRLLRPLAEGYLVNMETRKGHSARLKPGDPLPEVRTAIPSPEALAEVWGEGGVYPLENDCHTATLGLEPAPEADINRGSHRGSGGGVAPPHPDTAEGAGAVLTATVHGTATPTATVQTRSLSASSTNRGSVAVGLAGVSPHIPFLGPQGVLAGGLTPARGRRLVVRRASGWRCASSPEQVRRAIAAFYQAHPDRLPPLAQRAVEIFNADILSVRDTPPEAPDSRPAPTAGPPDSPCYACGGRRFWQSIHGPLRCATCHPPATPALVARWWGSPPPHPDPEKAADGDPAPPEFPGDDGRRVATYRVGQTLGFPLFPYAPGRAIAPGRDAWLTFLRTNPDGEIAPAWSALERLTVGEA